MAEIFSTTISPVVPAPAGTSPEKVMRGGKVPSPRRGRARMEVKGRPTYEPAQNGGKWPKMAEIFSTTLRVRS